MRDSLKYDTFSNYFLNSPFGVWLFRIIFFMKKYDKIKKNGKYISCTFTSCEVCKNSERDIVTVTTNDGEHLLCSDCAEYLFNKKIPSLRGASLFREKPTEYVEWVYSQYTKKNMTEADYINNKGSCCPYCHSEQIFETSSTYLKGVIEIYRDCSCCHGTWIEHYELVSVDFKN